ncbi:hypothetical protein [Adhaeretor mobilis]|uniref:PEP-CTERM protein-sorting domain-containing protein n=1 Tax=Adhaeretor mobilis TaxID=1930276 RepID=A0A517N2Y9_9BACT|nr:hypothetical protein [Adhaeretor mobilis]QDT01493.1 hypothetical protein HG15A2_48350 [Adhaeretor mobilis]
MKKLLICCLALVLCPSQSHAVLTFGVPETFDSAVTTGSTQAPDVWYTDRYAPAAFTSPVSFDGDNRLLHSISAADGVDNRPASFSSAFYNTQGRKYDLPAGTGGLSIDLYIPSDWATTGRRMAGLWGTGVDGSNTIADYPIIEFASDGSGPRFQVWDSGSGWSEIGLPSGFVYDAWYTLDASLAGSTINYSVGDITGSVPSLGSVEIDNVILQGHNTTDGVDYDIHWDNLTITAVPEPSAFLFGGLVCSVLGANYYRKNKQAKA